ncbi:MAG: hypothetical protein J2P54_25630, partial [Bradyrhizobiaceae bacterium]|nr:hypothetical protein [Bradyrhizobiaceae bacterium]
MAAWDENDVSRSAGSPAVFSIMLGRPVIKGLTVEAERAWDTPSIGLTSMLDVVAKVVARRAT